MELKKNKIKLIFIKLLMKKGKKSISEKIFNNILINLKIITKQKPEFLLKKSILKLSPKLKLINIQKKKKKYLFYLNKNQQIKISIFWIISFSKNKLSKNFIKNIINEIIQINNNIGKTLERKKNLYQEIKKLKYNFIF